MTKMKIETHLTRVSPGDTRAAPTQQFERQRTKCCVGVAQVQHDETADKPVRAGPLRQVLQLQQGFNNDNWFRLSEG